MAQKYLMNTIAQTHERAQEEGLGVSRNFIRQSVLNGYLPCVRAGNKRLINWDIFMDFLTNPPPAPEEPKHSASGIRAVPEGTRRVAG